MQNLSINYNITCMIKSSAIHTSCKLWKKYSSLAELCISTALVLHVSDKEYI